MKRLILALALIAGSAGVASAQTSTTHKGSTEMSAAEQDRLQFISLISELDASISRNNNTHAQELMTRIQQFMQTHTAAVNKQVAGVSDAASKAELQARVSQQTTIMNSVRGLAGNLTANRAEINTRLKDYLKNF